MSAGELQAFKENDLTETKVVNSFLPGLTILGIDRDTFFDQAFEAFPLGDVLYALDRAPLVGALTPENFRQSFFAIFSLFKRAATFELYLEVFRAIWGNDVDVTFSIPGNGKLHIDIDALSIIKENFIARRIEDDAYIYEEVIDHDGDNIAFREALGIKTQDETDALIFELSAAGVYTTTTLTIS